MSLAQRLTLSIAFCVTVSFVSSARAVGPDPVPLWPDRAPGAEGTEEVDTPTLRIYLPPEEKSTGTGVVICPGGGYGALAIDHEGQQVARFFNRIGVAGFVLRYRHAPQYRHPAPLNDAQRALRYVRHNAKKLGIVPHRVGIMGFSAGGHLTSTAATHFDAGDPDAADPIDRQSCRPNFAILGYPVISFTEKFGHSGSMRNLLGPDPDPALIENLSNEKQVTEETPPTFLFHTGADRGVPVENSLAFYAALRKAGVPAELHVYQDGPHGVGLAPGHPTLSNWPDRLAAWLKASGLLSDVERAAVSGTATIDGEPIGFGTITFTPVGQPHAPVASGRVRRGKYTVESGAVIGKCTVEIRTLGSVEPQPTIDDAATLPKKPGELQVDVREGKNEFDFDVKSE